MNKTTLLKAREVILRDAIYRDMTTARRAALLDVLWDERFLTREQLIQRVEQRLGKFCFGIAAWKDNFYRDMRVVKQAFRACGYHLEYSRGKDRQGYYLADQPMLSVDLAQMIRAGAAEVDPRQIAIYRRLFPAERFRQGCAISDMARKVVAYRIRQENTEMTPAEANQLALQRAYRE